MILKYVIIRHRSGNAKKKYGMEEHKETIVPQWYLTMDHDVIIGGLDVIEN